MHVAAPREKIPSWTAFKEDDGFDLDEGDPKKMSYVENLQFL